MRRKARRLTASILNSSSEFWLRVHIAATDGLRRKTNVIYNRISWQRPKQAEDFLYQARSYNRQDDVGQALSALEAGLNEYPGSEILLEHYLRTCCEQERLARFIDFIDPTKKQLVETLARLEILDPSDEKPTDGPWKSSTVWLTQDIVDKNFGDDLLKLWRLADLLDHADKLNITRKIHHKIARRRTHEPEDYLYGGVSEMRLGNIDGGFRKLELGLAAHPQSENLKSVFKECCHGQIAFDRYLRFTKILSKDGVETRLALNFYCEAFRKHPPEAFIVRFKEAEINCDPAELLVLQEAFLTQLRDNKVPLEKAKLCIFLSRLLGISTEFSERMFIVLYSLDWGRDDKAVKYTLMLINKLTLPLVPNYDFDPEEVVRQFSTDAQTLAQQPITLIEPVSDFSKHWAVWQSFLCLVQPRLSRHAMSAFETLAFKLWPRLDYTAPHIGHPPASQGTSNRKIRIGFTVLDSMPMMSGLMERLDKDVFETVFLRVGKRGESKTSNDWIARAGTTVEYSDTDAYSAIDTIARQELDILISGPCVPQIFFPLMARLAHLHMVLLEPNWPDGIKNSDYYISWQLAEPENYTDFYKTSVSLLRNPPYWIEKLSSNDTSAISDEAANDIRLRLLSLGPKDRVYICANTPPKIHPLMDEIVYKLLEADRDGYVVFLRGDNSPAQLLRLRLREKLGRHFEKIIFVNTLKKNDAHSLLLSADCCIDSHPICGMSSSFDGIMLGVPIVTLPADIPFGRWTAAIYEYLGVSGLTAKDVDEYIAIAMRLAMDKDWRLAKSAEIREKSSLYVESMASFDGFQDFLVQAWRRKQSGLPPASWVSGEWQS